MMKMLELTTCRGRKLLVNPKYLQTACGTDEGHSFLEIDGYGHTVEVTQSVETIQKLLQ